MNEYIGKKEGIFYTFAIIIVTILCIGTISYIIYDKFIKEDEIAENVETEENIETEESRKLGLELFNNLITLRNGYYDYLFIPYLKENITYETLDYPGIILENLISENDKNINLNYNEEKCIEQVIDDDSVPEDETYYNECNVYYVEKIIIDEIFHKTFGLNKTIDYNNTYLSCGIFKEKDNKVYAFNITGCGGASDGIPYIKYNYSLFNNNDLEVYVDYIFVEGATEIEKDPEDLFLENEITKYKVTFKKDTNGNYYWYSSEIIK